jgi:hypothetical protein
MLEECYLAFTGAGTINLSERTDKDRGCYGSVDLIDIETTETRLAIGWDGPDEEETDKVHLRISQHHAINDDTGRVFHAILSVSLGLDELRRLRNMINFLLEK